MRVPLGEMLMRGTRFAPLACFVLLADTGATHGNPNEDARMVIAVGIKAQGGEAKPPWLETRQYLARIVRKGKMTTLFA